jgi:hypothetical protein
MFKTPSIWDLLSLITGILGLVATGTIVVSIAPSFLQVLGLAGGVGMMVGARLFWSRHNEQQKFPFHIEKVETRLDFSIGPSTTDGRITPVGKLTRTELMRPTSASVSKFTRFQLVTDPPQRQSKAQLRLDNYKLNCQIHRRYWNKTTAVRSVSLPVSQRLDEFRRVYIDVTIPKIDRRELIEVSEELVLANNFSDDEEFYRIAISDLVKNRSFVLRSPKIKVTSAWFELSVGASDHVEINHVEVKDYEQGSTFAFDLRKLRPGTEIAVKWRWDLSTAPKVA